MEIYLDVLVVLNTYLSWIQLSLCAAVSKTLLKPIRCAAASFIGGLSSLIILIPNSVKLYAFTSLALKMISCLVIVFTAFGRRSAKKEAALSLTFFISGILLSGAAAIFNKLSGTRYIDVSRGFIYFKISPLALVLSTAAAYAILTLFSKIFSQVSGAVNSYRIDFVSGCKAFSLDGIADTGNKARDLFSGLPVIICTGVELKDGNKLRAVPYKTLTGEGILYAFSPESIHITDSKGNRKSVSALVASIDSAGEQRAIFNPEILDN